jgi:hypothetical protein
MAWMDQMDSVIEEYCFRLGKAYRFARGHVTGSGKCFLAHKNHEMPCFVRFISIVRDSSLPAKPSDPASSSRFSNHPGVRTRGD